MIPALRTWFNQKFTNEGYDHLLARLETHCGGPIPFRVAETPIFLPAQLVESMAKQGADLAVSLLADRDYLSTAQRAIPAGYNVAQQNDHPHFLTADFGLTATASGDLVPRLVEIQAFPSVFAYQAELCRAYCEAYDLPGSLGIFLGGLDESSYWELFSRTILGEHNPENVVLTEIDPTHQKTFPDFYLTARRLGIAVIDITSLEPVGNKLHYRNDAGRLIPVDRIYNRAIADELMARDIQLPFDLSHPWDVEWAGHPNWYFLISKFSIPWLARSGDFPVVPPAAFLDDFLAGPGREFLAAAGVPLPKSNDGSTVYEELLLKPLFSFAGKGIEFAPERERLEGIPAEERSGYLVQQRMRFEPTIETPFGLTQAEIRVLYMWPDHGELTAALCLVRLGRGKMMGVDHNKNQKWVGGSAAFCI